MSKSNFNRASGSVFLLTALAANLLFLTAGARAQLCFDVFSTDDSPLLQCADSDYFVDSIEPGFDPDSFTGSGIGRHSASFDGADLFSDPDVMRPGNLPDPFFSSASFSAAGSPAGATSFDLNHRGSVNMTATASEFQSAAYQTRSRVTFMPINTVDPSASITVKLVIDFDFELADPLENATMGAALAGFGISFIGAESDPFDAAEFDVSALAELDTSEMGDDLKFFGFDNPDLDDATLDISIFPEGSDFDDSVDVSIGIELELAIDDFELGVGEPIIMELDTFGSIFSDGFESGDTAAWSASSPDTFKITISSSDPNVRFVIIPEPSGAALLLLASLGLLRRRR